MIADLLRKHFGQHIVLCLVAFLMLVSSAPGRAEESRRRLLRVAFPQVAGMSWTAADGSRHGLLVDYLNEIAKYTGWEYEYIDTDNQTLLNDFKEGKYELLGGHFYIPGLEQFYAYPDYNTGYSRSVLLARYDDRSIHSYDLESMNGKTIGVYKNARENIRRLKEFIAINGLHCNFRYLTFDEIVSGRGGHDFLMNGEIDLLLNKFLMRRILSGWWWPTIRNLFTL